MKQRSRIERKILRPYGQRARIPIDPDRREIVEVFLARTPRMMRAAARKLGNHLSRNDYHGVTLSWELRKFGGRYVRGRALYGHIVARLFLNVTHLRLRPAEIISHEAAHVAMAWVRYLRVDVTRDEECLAYAVGRVTAHLNEFLICRPWGTHPHV